MWAMMMLLHSSNISRTVFHVSVGNGVLCRTLLNGQSASGVKVKHSFLTLKHFSLVVAPRVSTARRGELLFVERQERIRWGFSER